MTHRYEKIFSQIRYIHRFDYDIDQGRYCFKTIGRKFCRTVMVSSYEMFPPIQPFNQRSCFLSIIKCQITQNVDSISSVDLRIPQISQPIVVCLSIVLSCKRPFRTVTENVPVSEMQICCKKYSIHALNYYCRKQNGGDLRYPRRSKTYMDISHFRSEM